jgi:hypothetical protein
LPSHLQYCVTPIFTISLICNIAARLLPPRCSPDDPSQPRAELFATDSTAVINDSDDPRLRDRLELFKLQVGTTILANDAVPTGSLLVDGIYWSPKTHRTTYARAREFHISCMDELQLHRIADQVRQQFHQESVLTFEDLPSDAPEVDAVTLNVPDVNTSRLHDAFAGDPIARDRLLGGSVTEGHTLILVADIADLGLARQLSVAAGGQAHAVTVQYGRREFVGW